MVARAGLAASVVQQPGQLIEALSCDLMRSVHVLRQTSDCRGHLVHLRVQSILAVDKGADLCVLRGY